MRHRSTWLAVVWLSIALCTACGHSVDNGHGGGDIEDSPEARHTIAGELAQLADRAGGYDNMLDDGATVAQAATADALAIDLGRELNDDEVAAVGASLRLVLSEFVSKPTWSDIVTQSLEKHFTASELAAIRDFYGSAAGQRLLAVDATVVAEIEGGIDAGLEARLDEFIARIDVVLEEALPGLADAGQ